MPALPGTFRKHRRVGTNPQNAPEPQLARAIR
jgi:hypothetical protein